MKFNFNEYKLQDLMCKGQMRRRYDSFKESYKGYSIYKYMRGEYARYCAQDEEGNIFVETDNIEEVKDYIDNRLLSNTILIQNTKERK